MNSRIVAASLLGNLRAAALHHPARTVVRNLASTSYNAADLQPVQPSHPEILSSLIGTPRNVTETTTGTAVESSASPASQSAPFGQVQEPYIAIPPAEDPLLRYLASHLTKHGHRARGSRQASRVLLHLHAFTRAPPLPIFREALMAAAPAVRTISTKRGSKQVFCPVPISEKRRIWYAVNWVLEASKARNGQTVEERIARELIAVLQGESSVLRKKEEVHKFAMVNRYAGVSLSLASYANFERQGYSCCSLDICCTWLLYQICIMLPRPGCRCQSINTLCWCCTGQYKYFFSTCRHIVYGFGV
jgi:small subunit ribosomal protein S7